MPRQADALPASAAELARSLRAHAYLADEGLAVALFLALSLRQPLLLEGEAGVGKTEAAKAAAAALGRELVRLQCYEGIERREALYDWDYARQLLAIRAAEQGGQAIDVYRREFLVARPLLQALESERPVVLLIDEIDRADEAFDAFLLELLADFQVTVPELGSVRAKTLPLVVLTSNRTREPHDALKRRCLYHWIPFPDPAREAEVLRARVPELPPRLAERVSAAAARVREAGLYKPPGIGESISWAQALLALGSDDLESALGAALKVHEDVERVTAEATLSGL
jgi:MoxR-like ATPase